MKVRHMEVTKARMEEGAITTAKMEMSREQQAELSHMLTVGMACWPRRPWWKRLVARIRGNE